MLWKILLILVIALIILLLFTRNTNKPKFIQKYIVDRMEVSSRIYGNKFPSCLSIPPSSSYGLLADASIVCNIIKNFPKTPYFYYENFPDDFDPNGLFFPNIDMTNFLSLAKKKSPKTLLCKTKQIYNMLKNFFQNKTVIFTGFTSFDKYDPKIKKDYRKIIHIPGKSPFKGSETLLKTWLKHPEWPELTIISRDNVGKNLSKTLNKHIPQNVKLLIDFLDENDLSRISNEYGIHICSSRHEGFGHYIHEAKAVKAVVLYTDAPSMNETFKNGIDGIGIPCISAEMENYGFCPAYDITEKGLEEAVNKVINMSELDLQNIGENARKSYIEETNKFESRLKNIVMNELQKFHNLGSVSQTQEKYSDFGETKKIHFTNLPIL